MASYSYWMENRDSFVVDNVTAMTGPDSYYWLMMAGELEKGTQVLEKPHPLKGYPDQAKFAIKDKPGLLAELINLGGKFTGGDYYRAGLMLIPLLSGLFIFPLFLYFHRLGFGASAVLGGLIGSFSNAYYARTKMGRLDTDLLNTFFPLLAGYFILLMRRERSWRANILLAAGAGATMYFFTRWYQQPSFILIYLLFMAVYLVFSRVPWKQIIFILPVFLLASGPEYVMQITWSVQTFLKAYVAPPPTGLIAWPNILDTVGEAQERGLLTTLEKLHGLLPLVFIGFGGVAYLCVRRFRLMIPIAPLLILGLWSLVGPNRFAMYMAIFIGTGIGVVTELLVRFAAYRTRMPDKSAPAVSAALMFLLFFATAGFTGFGKHPPPVLNAPTTRALLDIKKIVPQNSAIFTPYWELGYPLMEIGEFATYHDGGLQGGIRTTLAARAMISDDQEDMISLLSYVEDHGFKGLNATIKKENLSADRMLDLVFNYPKGFSGENVYVLYLEKMIWKIYSLSYIGTWDFDRRQTKPMDYVEIYCKSLVNNIMTCTDGTVDLNRGVMNDGTTDIPMRGVYFVNDGYIVNQKTYPRDTGYHLQVLMKKGKVYMILVADDRLFRTNFNQQFLLGRYDRRYFEEVYISDFPTARLLRVKGTAVSAHGGKEDQVVRIGTTTIAVELADTPEKREKGLMNRTSLAAGKGMLFVYDREKFLHFWMKNTSIPLSIAYIDGSGRITEIRELEPFSQMLVRSSYPVQYALEVNHGFFAERGIKVGDTVELPVIRE
jgi:dolichyl-diphosphooligosaccharide--protein glycosyltransferase